MANVVRYLVTRFLAKLGLLGGRLFLPQWEPPDPNDPQYQPVVNSDHPWFTATVERLDVKRCLTGEYQWFTVLATGTDGERLGGVLALVNAVTTSIYLIIGRKIRDKVPFLPYSWLVFFGGAVVSTGFVLVTHTPVMGFSWMGYFWVGMAALIGQMIGHTFINASLHYFSATVMSLAMQISVIASAVIAFFYLGEIPSPWQILGSGLILLGVLLVTWMPRSSK